MKFWIEDGRWKKGWCWVRRLCCFRFFDTNWQSVFWTIDTNCNTVLIQTDRNDTNWLGHLIQTDCIDTNWSCLLAKLSIVGWGVMTIRTVKSSGQIRCTHFCFTSDSFNWDLRLMPVLVLFYRYLHFSYLFQHTHTPSISYTRCIKQINQILKKERLG